MIKERKQAVSDKPLQGKKQHGKSISLFLSLGAFAFYLNDFLSSPRKKAATVPGPQCEAMIVPMLSIFILPLSLGNCSSSACFVSSASSGQFELLRKNFPSYSSPSRICFAASETSFLQHS